MKPFVVHVDQIEESGQPFEARYLRADLDELLAAEPPSGFTAAGDAEVRLRLSKVGSKVLAQARFPVPLAGPCRRCLTEVKVTAEIDATLAFVRGASAPPPPVHYDDRGDREDHGRKAKAARAKGGKVKEDTGESERAGSFEPETADEVSFEGKELDLRPVLREQILLSLPSAPLCRPDCKGLCVVCGQDLNLLDCGHRPDRTDLRWAALKDLRLDPTPDRKV